MTGGTKDRMAGGVWPFEGRAAELALVRSAFATGVDESGGAKVDGRPRVDVVLLTGPVGVGKTRLAREALSVLGADRTVWVAATRAAAPVPFAAVAALLPDDTGDATGGTRGRGGSTGREGLASQDRLDVVAFGRGIGVVRAAARRVAGWGGRSRTAIVVDDAPLLDDASATLVAHLVREGLAFVVLTARTGEQLPDVLLHLVRDGHGPHRQATRLELAPLPNQVVDRLIGYAVEHGGTSLDGPVGAGTRRRLRRAAAGNPLALRELLHGAEAGGLTELVTGRLAGLDPQVRYAVELVACGEPLPVPMLRSLVGLDTLVRAEDTGLIVVEDSGRRRIARLDHPMYGEVLRSRLSRSRLMRTHAALAGALLATPMRRRTDTLQAALWQVEAGVIERPDVLRAGAWTAVGHADLHLAERLARAARDAAPGAAADRLLAEILTYRGRTAEARPLLATPPPPDSAGDPAELAGWVVTKAETLYWGDGDIAAALDTLDAAHGHPLARASRSWLLFFDARCAEAAALADEVRAAAGDDVDPKALIWATASGCAARGFLGQRDEAIRIHQDGAPIATAHAHTLPWGPVQVDTGMTLAHLACGYPGDAQTVADAGYQHAIGMEADGGAAMMVSAWALHAGLAALARGHLDQAERLLAEAQTGFETNDTFRMLRCCLAARAATTALTGRPGTPRRMAQELMARADGLANNSNRVLDPWIETWRAWTQYAAGDLAAAAAAATRAADLARQAGMPAVEALALYELTRLGAPMERVRLDRLDRIDHELAQIVAQATRAIGALDGAADLEHAARALHERGYDLHAAELYTAAGRRHHRQHRWARADLALGHAVELTAAFPAARTPLLQLNDLTSILSYRERQVLLLAAGHTSAQIAERLHLAVTTVNNTLARAYHKLGINGRAQLRKLLEQSTDK